MEKSYQKYTVNKPLYWLLCIDVHYFLSISLKCCAYYFVKCLCLSSFLLQYENVAYHRSCNVFCDNGTGFSVNVLVSSVKHHSVNDTYSFTVP